MRIRKTIGISLLVFGAVVAALCTIDTSVITRPVESLLVKRAAQHGIRLSLTDTAITLTSARARRAELYVPLGRFFVLLLEATDFTANVKKVSLVRLSPALESSATTYGGLLTGVGEYNLIDRSFRGELSLKDANLGEHPQLRSLGITKGFLTVDAQEIRSVQGEFPSGTATISVREGSKPDATHVSLIPLGIPFRITLPQVENLSLRTTIQSTKSSLSSDSLECTSSLGSVRGKGSATIGPNGSVQTLSIELDVSLSESGQAAIGPYLPLLSEGALSTTTEHFSVRIKGNASRPKVQYF